MSSYDFIRIVNGQAINRDELPVIPFRDFRRTVIDAVKAGARISAMPAWRPDRAGPLRVIAVLSRPLSGDLVLAASDLPDPWQSLTPDCPSAHWFEREIAETWHVRPLGHPWLKPIRFLHSHEADSHGSASVGITEFFRIAGDESQ
jgi:hypothetical protein